MKTKKGEKGEGKRESTSINQTIRLTANLKTHVSLEQNCFRILFIPLKINKQCIE